MPSGGPIVMSKEAIEERGCMEDSLMCAMLKLYAAVDEYGEETAIHCCVSELELACSCAKHMIPKEEEN